jgi:hypothetical protein
LLSNLQQELLVAGYVCLLSEIDVINNTLFMYEWIAFTFDANIMKTLSG